MPRLGAGELLFRGLDLPALGYQVVQGQGTEKAMHVVVRRGAGSEG